MTQAGLKQMIKRTIAVASITLSIGAIGGYLISEATRPNIAQAINAPIATPSQTPKPVPVPRADLELRYQIAVGYQVRKADLARFTDERLNNLVSELEARRKQES